MTSKNQLDALMDWYGSLTPESLSQIESFYANGAYFKDPFNEVTGIAAIKHIFAHMFTATEDPRFVIGERLLDGDQAFVTWTFSFALKGKPYVVVGGSHLRFDAQGRVVLHRDYWDAAEELLQKLPLIGAPVRWLRRQLATPPAASSAGHQ